jgi:hypothetical protein
MPGKKQIDIDNWKATLDSPDNLRGEGALDKDAAWEKLYGRLHAAPARRIAWYWIAAVVLTLLAVSWLMTTPEKNNMVKAIVPLVQDTKSIVPSAPANFTEKTAVAIMPSTKKQPETGIGIGPAADKSSYKKAHSFYTAGVVSSAVQAIEIKPAAAISAPVTAGSIKTELVTGTKKKLRVIHINELETMSSSGSEQPALAAAQEKSNLKFRIKNNTSGNPSAPARQEDTGIRIPLTN